MVFDHSGSVVALAQKEFRQIFPKPGWVEHDATEIWATQLHTATEALGKAGLTAADIAAVGITNQRETTVVWERDTGARSEEHTSELQSPCNLVCRLLLEKKKKNRLRPLSHWQ